MRLRIPRPIQAWFNALNASSRRSLHFNKADDYGYLNSPNLAVLKAIQDLCYEVFAVPICTSESVQVAQTVCGNICGFASSLSAVDQQIALDILPTLIHVYLVIITTGGSGSINRDPQRIRSKYDIDPIRPSKLDVVENEDSSDLKNRKSIKNRVAGFAKQSSQFQRTSQIMRDRTRKLFSGRSPPRVTSCQPTKADTGPVHKSGNRPSKASSVSIPSSRAFFLANLSGLSAVIETCILGLYNTYLTSATRGISYSPNSSENIPPFPDGSVFSSKLSQVERDKFLERLSVSETSSVSIRLNFPLSITPTQLAKVRSNMSFLATTPNIDLHDKADILRELQITAANRWKILSFLCRLIIANIGTISNLGLEALCQLSMLLGPHGLTHSLPEELKQSLKHHHRKWAKFGRMKQHLSGKVEVSRKGHADSVLKTLGRESSSLDGALKVADLQSHEDMADEMESSSSSGSSSSTESESNVSVFSDNSLKLKEDHDEIYQENSNQYDKDAGGADQKDKRHQPISPSQKRPNDTARLVSDSSLNMTIVVNVDSHLRAKSTKSVPKDASSSHSAGSSVIRRNLSIVSETKLKNGTHTQTFAPSKWNYLLKKPSVEAPLSGVSSKPFAQDADLNESLDTTGKIDNISVDIVPMTFSSLAQMEDINSHENIDNPCHENLVIDSDQPLRTDYLDGENYLKAVHVVSTQGLPISANRLLYSNKSKWRLSSCAKVDDARGKLSETRVDRIAEEGSDSSMSGEVAQANMVDFHSYNKKIKDYDRKHRSKDVFLSPELSRIPRISPTFVKELLPGLHYLLSTEHALLAVEAIMAIQNRAYLELWVDVLLYINVITTSKPFQDALLQARQVSQNQLNPTVNPDFWEDDNENFLGTISYSTFPNVSATSSEEEELAAIEKSRRITHSTAITNSAFHPLRVSEDISPQLSTVENDQFRFRQPLLLNHLPRVRSMNRCQTSFCLDPRRSDQSPLSIRSLSDSTIDIHSTAQTKSVIKKNLESDGKHKCCQTVKFSDPPTEPCKN